MNRWDSYFHNLCVVVGSKSPCMSRTIGAILVFDHSIVATGYNGPPRGTPHCGMPRYIKDNTLDANTDIPRSMISTNCPRRLMGFKSGTGLEWCPAQHAETNCIANAARLGVSTLNTILYMNSVIPCKNCFGMLINAGIKEVVIEEATAYDEHSKFIIDNSNILIREFEL